MSRICLQNFTGQKMEVGRVKVGGFRLEEREREREREREGEREEKTEERKHLTKWDPL